MIVAYSRPAAMEIYQRLCELRPSWKEEGKLGVVMTMGNQDPEWWFDIVGNKAHVKEMAKRFKDDNDPLKIVIVVDMWLTGFDVPSLSTMYVYKPMKGYNLMQAIARVNRVQGQRGAAWSSTTSVSPTRSSPQCATTPSVTRKSTVTWISAKPPIPNS